MAAGGEKEKTTEVSYGDQQVQRGHGG
ncbi:MAG: hypothetical protein QOJ46_1037, partial [bacterium]